MSINFSMHQLMEAKVHFGHSPTKWHPSMAPYIYGKHAGMHIINLGKTVPLLTGAIDVIRDISSRGGRFLFVGTKPQASAIVQQAALSCNQHWVNHRWLGGMLTNWKTVSRSIVSLKKLIDIIEKDAEHRTKKELLQLTRKKNNLEKSLGGVKNMGGIPSAIIIIDVKKEAIPVLEAKRLKVPVIGIVDTNADIKNIDFPVPGNDDSVSAIQLYCDLFSAAIIEGKEGNAIEAKGAV